MDAELIAGIAAYRRHPYQGCQRATPTLWREGGSRLLEYGGDGPRMLFVPSLINRLHVLDLMEDHSCLRWLAARGLRPAALDWGWPETEERGFDLAAYVLRLERAMEALGEPLVLAGYCMGGLLAIAAALRRPASVTGLMLLATPWDFASPHAAAFPRLLAGVEPMLAREGALPVDWLQTLFASLDPERIHRKYRDFARLSQDSFRARLFVALEDWLADGVPVAAPVAREVLGGWYGANTPMRGEWLVAGETVRPEALRLPTFIAAPNRDSIVPPASGAALARLVPEATLHVPGAGHVGMVAGSNAEAALWEPMLEWLRQLA